MNRTVWIVLAVALVVACGDDEASTTTTTTTTTTGSGASGGSCGFMAGGGYGGFGDVCMAMGSDDDCVACTRMNCCTELGTCETDTNCSCVLTCFESGTDPICCLDECGQNDTTDALVQCAINACQNECAG
jgi:hypothetical protein